MIEDLYTVKDTKRIRELLLKNQRNKDSCTDLELLPKDSCLDHAHDSEQLVRGVLHRQVNSYIGKLENTIITSSQIHESGWVIYSMQTTTISTNGKTNIKVTVFLSRKIDLNSFFIVIFTIFLFIIISYQSKETIS